MKQLRPRALTIGALFLLFAINAYVCQELFWVEFTQRMEAIESSYMSISRWAMDHWQDRSWFPVWFTGTPFHRVYQPGLHLTVASVARTLGWTPQHTYHFVTGLMYCLGPVTFFWLCYTATRRRGYAFVAALLYSLISPLCFAVPGIHHDAGGFFLPRRYQVLVHYGEGPHMTAMFLLPLVIWVLHRAMADRDWRAIAATPVALAVVPLTNWPGTIGLSMAIAAYVLSRVSAIKNWAILLCSAVLAYLISCSWIPPSILRAVTRNAQQSDATMLGISQLAAFAGLAAALFGLHRLFERFRAGWWVRFCSYFTLITGAVSIGREWLGWRLLPQPNRFQIEWEMGVLALVALALAAVYTRLPKRMQTVCIAAVALFCVMQVRQYRRYARRVTQPIDITSTIEYRMAKWFDANMQGRRVFAPANVSFWMNMFTDVPQVAGCCDQGIPTQQYRIATYVIYTGQNAGARDAEISILWLKAFGADAIGVTGPDSTEYYKPYWNPRKFEGVLPLLWRNGDNAVYRVPRRSASLAHVIPKSAVVARPAENGLDTGPLEPLVAAMEDTSIPPAAFRWLNQHEAEIDATVQDGQVVFAQITFDHGWRATSEGVNLRIASDALGMMVVDPGRSGPTRIRLTYDGGLEARITTLLTAAGFLLLLLWSVWWRARVL
jgi:hypothetical protein